MRTLIAPKPLVLATVLFVAPRPLAQDPPFRTVPPAAVEAAVKHALGPEHQNSRVGLVPEALPPGVAQEVEKRTGWRVTSFRDEIVCESRGKCRFRTVDVLVKLVSAEAGGNGSVRFVVERRVVRKFKEYSWTFLTKSLVTVEPRGEKWEVTKVEVLEIS